ncbi:hypothetical protein N7508_003881 [Penicillium antarcticum]|uniref:uncharacterized protein n=1 Tax=Penicillium antarcticum TaxID=416450 RepID=UPI002393B399|nr:uncharacterized protein N7508_003881 [Penicillium antarcticum]KAJ5313051.1 hypothetical protein N7508_003881 [Penicillium antarcticum]
MRVEGLRMVGGRTLAQRRLPTGGSSKTSPNRNDPFADPPLVMFGVRLPDDKKALSDDGIDEIWIETNGIE